MQDRVKWQGASFAKWKWKAPFDYLGSKMLAFERAQKSVRRLMDISALTSLSPSQKKKKNLITTTIHMTWPLQWVWKPKTTTLRPIMLEVVEAHTRAKPWPFGLLLSRLDRSTHGNFHRNGFRLCTWHSMKNSTFGKFFSYRHTFWTLSEFVKL